MCITNVSSPFTSTCGKKWKEKCIIWEGAWEKGNSICISGPYMSNQSDDTMGQLHISFPLSCSCSTLTTTSVHELSSEITFYLKACFESSRWMKLWNIKDAISHRETVVYQSLMIRACWNIHIPCLPSNYSPWDLYKKSGLTASRMLWNDAGFGAVRHTSKYSSNPANYDSFSLNAGEIKMTRGWYIFRANQ